MEWISRLRARRHVRASFYRAALEDLPDGLEAGWRHGAPQEYPGIRTDAFFFVRAAEGLMAFFSAAGSSDGSRPCALPSEAADSVWHAWLRRDPIGLERFCRKHFGAAVPHVERAGLVDAAMVEAHRRRRRLVAGDSDGGSFTDGILAAFFASDSACADGSGGGGSDSGCDSGSSCGSGD